MTETYDVTLSGTGYMVKPGSYQRYQDGQSEGRVGRVKVFDFFGGGNRATQLERDRFWNGAGAWPTLDSQGISAGPLRTDRTLAVATAFDPTAHSWAFVYQNVPYVVSANRLYVVTSAAGVFGDLSLVRLLAGTVVDCILVQSTLYFAYSTSAAMGSYNLATSTYTANVFGSTAAQQAKLLGHEGTTVCYVKASGDDTTLYQSSGASVTSVDGYIRRLVTVDGHLWILTDQSLQRLTSVAAAATAEATMPRLGAQDDITWAVTHFGRLYTWIGSEVVYYDTTIDSFVGTGIRGQRTWGAVSIGTWLMVAMDSLTTSDHELWGYDGRGWWLLDTGAIYYYPQNITGFVSDADMFAGRDITSQQAATWQFFPRTSYPGLRSSFDFVTALLDAGDRDLDKVWRRAGVELATPDARATADSVTVTLYYSTDAGANWTQLATQNLTSSDSRLISIGGSISARPTSRFIQLKVSVSSISDWCPVIVGVWAEHETMDLPTRRRRWKFTAIAADQVIKRDGSVDSTGARTLASGLWDVWDNGAVVTFKDVDYDQVATTYNVRIAGIREVIRDLTTESIASSDLELTLVEV